MVSSTKKSPVPAKTLKDTIEQSFFSLQDFILKNPPLMVQTAKSICDSLLGVEPKEPNQRDLKIVYARLKKAFSKTGSLASVSRGDFRLAPWLIFSEISKEYPPLITQEGFLDNYLELSRKYQDPRAICTLTHVFLWKYPCEEAYFHDLADSLHELVDGMESISGKQLQDKCKEYSLLQEAGPDKIAQSLIFSNGNPEMVFGHIGLKGACLYEGIIEYAFLRWLEYIHEKLVTDTYSHIQVQVEIVIAFAVVNNAFRFPNKKNNLPEKLLLPFVNKKPVAECKELLKTFFVNYFGDPRIKQTGWGGVSKDAQNVLRSWLVEDTMEDFFRLLDYVAQHNSESDIDRMWKYRKAFWTAYMKNGLIEDAWVALGSSVKPIASRFLGDKKNNYASLRGGLSTHSILVMRMGDLVVVEWSHTGKCRFWHDSNNEQPKLYRRYYDKSMVIEYADEEFIHHGAKKYTWQNKTANYITRQTGASVLSKEYMISQLSYLR